IQLRNPNLEPDDLNKLLKEKQKLSFVTIVQEILAREASQPLLHLRRSESDQPSPKDCLEVSLAVGLTGDKPDPRTG
ncbi:hypothetical protein RR48_00097, partial [Papilio machaon]